MERNAKAMTSDSTEELLRLPIDEVLSRLNSSNTGLSSSEATRRLGTYGPNELEVRKRRTAIAGLLSHLRDPLVIILIFAGIISLSTGGIVDSTIVFTIVIISIFLDFYQESKAEKAAEMLKERVTTTATVLRDSAKQEVRLTQIVPGDVVYLSAGDIVPADARIIVSKDFFVNQSALTGESFPVEKTAAIPSTASIPLTERSNSIFLGTTAVSGTATAVVMRTGKLTEYGRIAGRLAAREPLTEFERGARRFGYLIMETTFTLVVFVFFINALYRRGVLESLLFSVALAVGLTPELLPMIISVNLSKGALAMSKRGVIVKRLNSIQNLGSMDVLCTDKTGTLTENKITLVLHINVEGKNDEKVLLLSYLNSYYETGLKSPLDEAILRFRDVDTRGYQKVDEVPFDFVRRRVSIVVENEKEHLLIMKGAPEEIIKISSSCECGEAVVDLAPELQTELEKKYRDLSSQGFRVLGVSYKRVKQEKQVYSVDDENNMIFVGFVAFIDPPKATAKESLQLLNNSGIRVKILTGDNELVTEKICDQLSLPSQKTILGNEISQMGDDALARKVEEATIFARVTPGQKERIMNALRHNGHVVGYLGDGINDAPSLKTADVGISVDNAVDVAKEAADIILLEKDLKVLQEGVLEGRKTFGNTMKYIMIGTSSNFGNMFSVAGASLFLPFLPMLPTQILLNNLLYDLSQTTIPTDNVGVEYLAKPRKWDISFIRRFMIYVGPISSIFDFVTFFIMLYVFNASESLFRTAWFLESLCTQTLVIFVIRTRVSPFYKNRPSRLLTLSSLSAIVIALALPFTPLGELFGFVRPPAAFYSILAGLLGLYLLLVEFGKKYVYR